MEQIKMGYLEYLENSWGGARWNVYVDRYRNLSDIVIYGTGVWGKCLFHLFQHYHIGVICFAVTEKGKNPDDIEGCPVKTIKELEDVKEKISIVLTMSESGQHEVADFLQNKGFKTIICFDKQDFWLSDIGVQIHRPEGKKICPVCGNELRVYLPYGAHMRFNVDCPWCASKERHRAYWLYWNKINFFNGKKIRLLHFAPERIFFDKISKLEFIDYYPVDIDPDKYGVKEKADITNIPYEDNMFDAIICNHVLEHIEDEKKALSELKRVLKTDGVAFLNVPVFRNYETTLEKPEYNTPELRLEYYGQSDHVRRYGRDYDERLRRAGFLVKEISINEDYSQEEVDKYGLNRWECIYECRKG